MQTYYTKWYSPSVGREMEIKVYGHAGRPVLFIPKAFRNAPDGDKVKQG